MSKKKKRKSPLEEFYDGPNKNKRKKQMKSIPMTVLRRFVGDLYIPKESGHEIKIQQIDATPVGVHVRNKKKLTIFRIDVWVDWWMYDMQQFPSSRIGKSYYQAYDKNTEKFYDLDKSTPNCFENFYAESKRKHKV